jgi:16S rRNA processing protein RimM
MSEPEVPGWDAMVLVGTIARTHGLQGQLIVNPETDFIEERFKAGASLWIRSGDTIERLSVTSSRIQKGRPIVAFQGYATIDDAERLVGRELRIPEGSLHPLDEGAYYRHQLVGCRVATLAGETVGSVRRVEDGACGSLLVVEGSRGEVLIPVAAEICVRIEVPARLIVIDPPDGLLDLNVPGRRGTDGRDDRTI